MRLVRLVKDWDGNENHHGSLLMFQQTPNNDGVWGDIQFTFEAVNECDYLIVFNRCRKNLKVLCPEGNAWLKAEEPPNQAFRWQKKSYKFFDRIYGFENWGKIKYNNYHIAYGTSQWQLNKSYMFFKKLLPKGDDKINKISFVTSSKNWMEGHQLRLDFVKYLQDKKYDYDLFGRGINPIDNKFDAIYPYKYSIAIENSFSPNYWTDKIADCFLSWTMPFYCGASNINKYFPKDSFVLINPKEPKKALDKIKRSVDEGIWEKNIDAIRKARELILNKYQFFPFIVNEINKRNAKTEHLIKKSYSIPQNIAPWEEGGENLIPLGRKIEWQIRKSMNLKPY